MFPCERTPVKFTRVNEIEARYERPRVNVKVERGSTFTSTRDLPYIFSLLFTRLRTEKSRDSGNPPQQTWGPRCAYFIRPLSMTAPFYACLKLLKVTRKGKKSKEGLEVSLRIELETSRTEGRARTNRANPSSLSLTKVTSLLIVNKVSTAFCRIISSDGVSLLRGTISNTRVANMKSPTRNGWHNPR